MDLNSKLKLDKTYSSYFKKYSVILERNSDYKGRDFLILEERYKRIMTPIVLEFENKLKKDFLDYLDSQGHSYDFYLNRSNFTSHFLGNGYRYLINNAFSGLRKAKILNLGPADDSTFSQTQKISHLSGYGIDTIQFYLTFGTFTSMLKGCKGVFLGPFVDSYMLSTESRFYKHSFFKMMTYVRYLRNRCAHSNQVLSKHFKVEINNPLNLDPIHTKYSSFRINHLAVIYFILNHLEVDRAKYYFKIIYWFLYKNRRLINDNFMNLNLEKNTHKTLRKTLEWNVLGFTFRKI